MAWRSPWPPIRPTPSLDARLRRAARGAPDRGQPALGARRSARTAGAAAPGQAARGGLPARRRDLRRGCRDLPAHRRERPGRDPRLKPRGERINVLTHCNAGWLATVDWGTALAPIYQAHNAGMPIHVWVDETRPRNQGASLTAWELAKHGVPHTVIADNAGGHLMQRGQGRLLHRRHRPHDAARRRLQQDRHLPEGAGGARQRRAVLCRPALSQHRLDDRGRRTRIPIEERHAHEVSRIPAAPRGARSSPSTCCPRAARPPIPPST